MHLQQSVEAREGFGVDRKIRLAARPSLRPIFKMTVGAVLTLFQPQIVPARRVAPPQLVLRAIIHAVLEPQTERGDIRRRDCHGRGVAHRAVLRAAVDLHVLIRRKTNRRPNSRPEKDGRQNADSPCLHSLSLDSAHREISKFIYSFDILLKFPAKIFHLYAEKDKSPTLFLLSPQSEHCVDKQRTRL